MFPTVDTRQPDAVRQACLECWHGSPLAPEPRFLGAAFGWIEAAFAGRNPDFEPLDTPYHDLEHTLQGTLCLSRILAAWHRHNAPPPLDARAVRIATLAILLHDTGYLKPRGDHSGTGAKFTRTHVERSTTVAHRFMSRAGIPTADIRAVQNLIHCTATRLDTDAIPFESPLHRKLGAAVGTADLLGQMAAPDYPRKLPLLHLEFTEAARTDLHPDTPSPCTDAAELVRRTPVFWERVARPRLEQAFEGIHRLLNDPWPDGPNEYLKSIASHIARLAGLPAGTDPAPPS